MAPLTTLADVLRSNGQGPAVICAGNGPRLTRSQLENEIKLVANLLRNSDIKPGDAVSIADANTVRACQAISMQCSCMW